MEKVDDFDKEVTIYKVDLPGMGVMNMFIPPTSGEYREAKYIREDAIYEYVRQRRPENMEAVDKLLMDTLATLNEYHSGKAATTLGSDFKFVEHPCLHDALDKADPKMIGQPRSLSCSCPRCSPHSMVSS